MNNPILNELHAVREQLLADSGGTLDALVDRLQSEEKQSDRPRYKAEITSISSNGTNSNEVKAEADHSSEVSNP